MVIKKLKERIKSLSGKINEDKIKKDLEEIETINIELDHRVSKLIAENEHLKQTYKQLYDSIKPARIRSKEQSLKDDLRKLKGKALVDNDVTKHPSDPEMLKIDVEPITPKFTQKNKVEAHPRKAKPSLKKKDCVVEPIGTAHVQHSKLNANSEQTVLSRPNCSLIGNVTISRVYYVEGLGHNLFSVAQFCDLNLEVAFRQHTCFIHNLEGVDLLTGSRGNNLYTLSLGDMMVSSPICLLSKASKTKSWLWHRRLSHLNFGAINHLARHGLVRGLPKLKFEKDHLYSACAMGKSKKKPHKPKSEDTNQEKHYLLHMDLYGPMRVTSVNVKKYILVIVDDYSRFTWVKCLRTDNGTEFVNQTLREYYEKVGISHETYVARSLQQNGVVERRNRTLIKAARTMLIYAKAPLLLWAEAVDTACYTQNRSIVRLRHGKTPYELLHDKLPDLSFFHVFGALCYPTNDSENLGKLQPKADIDFDELIVMASEHSSSGPALHEMTPATISSRLMLIPPPSTPFMPPSRINWDLLFQLLFDELLTPLPSVDCPAPEVITPIAEVATPEPAVSTDSPSSTTVDQDAPSPSNSQTTPKTQSPVIPNNFEEDNHDLDVAHMNNDPFFGITIPENDSEASSSNVIPTTATPNSEHVTKWTKDHPLDNIIGELERLVSTRLQLHEQALFCYYDTFLSLFEPKTYKDALTQSCWIEAMQEELNEFEHLEVWDRSYRIMDTTRVQQKALDDELVAPANRLKIGKSNLRLSLILKSKEPTLQVAFYALKLTPFYNAFEISVDVLEIYMQEFWVTVSRHHSSLRFKLNCKSHTVNVDNFRDMLKICSKLPGQKFDEHPLEEEILSFIRDLGHTGEIMFLSDVNVNHMHQPWRSFAAIINKCLSGKTTALESLRLSRAQILWGMYHNKKVDYVYLLWDDLVFQVENENSKKKNDMYYPRFTKVIIDYFVAKDQAIPRRNKMFRHYARDDFMFTTHLTNQAMLESEAYMTYHAYATGDKTPKPKSTKKKANSESSPKTKPTQASKGKRIKTSAKRDKAAKMKKSATKSKDLTVLSEVALSEADQMKLATKRSKKEFHSSHASGSGDGVDIQSKVPDEQQHTVSGTNEGAGDKPEVPDVPEYRSESEKESWTFSQGEDEEENDEHDSANDNDDEDDDQENNSGETESDDDGDNFKVSTPPDYEILDEEENQEDDDNVMGGEQEDEEDEELVSSLETELSELKQTNHFAEALSSIPGIIDNYFASKMKDAVNMVVQLQSNKLREEAQAENDKFLKRIDSNIKAIIKDQVKAQVSKIMPKVEKYVTESLGAEVLARSSNQPQTSYAAATSLSEFKLKKILIDKIKENKSMNRSDIQKNLYNTLIESYDKDLFASYGDVVTLKRGCDDQDKDKEPSAGSNRGTKSKPKSSGKSAQAEEHGPRVDDLEEPLHQEFNTGNDNVSLDDQLYRFREGDFKRLRRQGIEDMLLLLVRGKLTNLNLDERFALNVALKMYTRCIVIQQRLEDLQLAIESYQKKINLSRPDSYHSDLRKMTPCTAYHNIQGIIYQDDMDKNHLMRTDELHKFSDITLNHVRTILNDIATGIQMEYLLKRKWSKQDKQRARVMINAIDKKLRDRRLMRSLEKFVGRRPYRGDLRLLQRTI
ncbi:putative ribonuclease H-like domain-containing protein [Tanacetum coccineum]